MNQILCVDPGGTTGFARWDAADLVWKDKAFTAWGDADHFHAIETIEGYCKRGALDLLVCESFHLSPATLKKSTAGSLATIEIIGCARWLAYEFGIAFELQSPADAKAFSSDDKLKAIGWWTKGSDHARDATRHLMLAMARRRLLDLTALVV